MTARVPHDGAHWARYNAAQTGREPRELCRQVLALAGPGLGRTAIDLGCGAGVETRALLAAGWRVHAIDSAPDTRAVVTRTAADQDLSRLTIHHAPFADLDALPEADLVYAGYSLPYCDPSAFPRVWAAIRGALRPGGWFAGNFFGDHDSWAGTPGETYLSVDAVHALFEGLSVVSFVIEDDDGDAFSLDPPRRDLAAR
ncbi:Methyltransferase domain-containing protein [Quadrisphaera granulorum]|uniref:Methyltransferase family protein n=1 Tax=Quadrisphaera granulorum TaxID=317664 RepID=A0A315ZDF4_9ACTN|nr:class I SAM-dependent methyltransferase [Quadrisphaera granulorum]PWJ43655.1 methyltransferase family protein [Quadrisphaera granulorum]SZE99211.1 Methyltransferase domain-containing protein [Quadrisphaera granulorum]